MRPWTIVSGYAWKYPTAVAIIVAILIFYFRDYITPVISSHDFCYADSISRILEWFIPKISTHCTRISELIITDHPSMDIVILLDIWNVMCFVAYLAYSVYKLVKLTKAEIHSSLRKHWHGQLPSGFESIGRCFFCPLLTL